MTDLHLLRIAECIHRNLSAADCSFVMATMLQESEAFAEASQTERKRFADEADVAAWALRICKRIRQGVS